MNAPLDPSVTDMLIELQDRCDQCKEAITSESNVELRLGMQKVCEKCQKVRMSVPELVDLKRKLQSFYAEYDAKV